MVHDGDTVVDIGAHIDIFSMLAARRGPNVRVHAFEPEQDNFSLLQANVECNPTLAVAAYDKAVTYGATEGNLIRSGINTGGHSLMSDGPNVQRVACIDLPASSMRCRRDASTSSRSSCEGERVRHLPEHHRRRSSAASSAS